MTHYDTLGVAETATPEEITAAYRKIQKEYHPDVYKGDNVEFAQEKVKSANAAYEVLHDPSKKAEYDRMLKYGAYGPQSCSYGPQANPYGQQYGAYGQQTNPYGQQGSPFGQYGPFYTYSTSTRNQTQRRPKRLGSLGAFVVRLATLYLILRLFGMIGLRLPFFFFFF